MTDRHLREWDYLMAPHVCKYCRQRFYSVHRYLFHLRHHELWIRPYWYNCKRTIPKYQIHHRYGKQKISEERDSVCGDNNNKKSLKRNYSNKKYEWHQSSANNSYYVNSGITEHGMINNEDNALPRPSCTFWYLNLSNLASTDHRGYCSEGELNDYHSEYPVQLKVETDREICTNRKLYKCKFCSRVFTRTSGVERHERIHTKEKPFKCSVCKKAFSEKGNMQKHERIHFKVKPFKCNYCLKDFAQKSHLITHEWIHAEKKPFKCKYCEKPLTTPSHVIIHERIHTNENPFKCKYCNKGFRTQSYVKDHEWKHTNEKPYKCKYCNKGFPRQSHVVVHERTHTNEKPFQCKYCKKYFRSGSYVKKHERMIHTGEKP